MKSLILVTAVATLAGCAAKISTRDITLARDRVASVTMACRSYVIYYGSLPASDNAEIYSFLTGRNKEGKTFYNPYEEEKGKLRFLDSWGREVRFFRNNSGALVAWSAGPDGEFSEAKSDDDVLGDFYPAIRERLNEK